MNTKELRIGNLVNIFLGVNDDGAQYVIHNMSSSDIYKSDIHNFAKISAIPLTEEFLVKFGFEKQETILHTFFKNDYGDFYFSLQLMNNNSFHLRIRNDSQENERYTGLGIFKYVHQLQNLYFCLCGKELELSNQNVM